jgi:hypothetical protein
MGNADDIVGVWIDPVTAQVTMTFRRVTMRVSSAEQKWNERFDR